MAFNPRKAAQIVAFFTIRNGGQIDMLRALKMTYVGDRESIRVTGFPMLDEARYSLPLGPVPDRTYAYLKGEVFPRDEQWSSVLTDKADYRVGLRNPALTIDDLDELSDAEVDLLEQVWARIGGLSTGAIVNWTHDARNIPEWEDPAGSAHPIPLARIMRYVGLDNADEQAALVNDAFGVDEVFASLRA